MNAAELLVRCLEQEQIEYVFGVPGEENADLLFALDESSSIRFILTRHEQGAAFMADVYGRLTGNPAVALSTLGPGATNLVTGVANATMDRSPMIALTAQGDTRRQHKESHQVLDIVSMFRPLTKWATSIRHADDVPEVVRKAVRIARSEKPGAVQLELPEDIAGHDATAVPLVPRRFRRPRPGGVCLERARELFCASRRPIIIAGNGTIRRRASDELRRFCELTGIGVVSTFMGKGCVDMDAEYCLFTIGLEDRDQLSEVIDESDLIVTIGYDMAEYPPRLWNGNLEKPNIHIDFTAAEIDAHYHPELELIGDIATTLELLTTLFECDRPLNLDLQMQREARESLIQEFAAHRRDDTEGSIRPQKVLWDVRQALQPHDILLSGVGAHKMWIARYYHCHEPNTCLISNGFCAMGMPLPGAIAAWLVHRDRHIFAIAGDGDFLMNVQEMETATRLGANITVMVWEDHEYGLIKWKQQSEHGRHVSQKFGNPNWKELASSFGWNCETVRRSADLAAAIDRALHHRGPALVVVPIDYRENQRLSERLRSRSDGS